MNLSKAGKLAGLLCLLLMGFAGASYGAVRWDVVQSPTEVINTGRSEVLGYVTLYAVANGTTGTASGGYSQIGFIYQNGVQIDNTITTGIKLFTDIAFPTATPPTISVENLSITGRCTGFLTINLPPGVAVTPGQFMRVEGVRGRIDLSDGITVNTDLFVQLQSINDPAANQFNPDTVRVAKSLPPLTIDVSDASILLCFPSIGTVDGEPPSYYINIKEGFVRAFVNYDNNIATNRADSYGARLGEPTTATRFRVVLNSIPSSVSTVEWPSVVYNNTDGSSSWLQYSSKRSNPEIGSGYTYAEYIFYSSNQTGWSDTHVEDFDVRPVLLLASGGTTTGTVLAAVTMRPFAGTDEGCEDPGGSNQSSSNNFTAARPRFATLYQSSNGVTSTDITSTSFDLYATIVRCNCFLLFTYVTKDSFFNTGLAIANTTGDDEVFGATVTDKITGLTTGGAPNQIGAITFYFYDKAAGYVGTTTTTATYGPGTSFVALLSQILPSNVTTFSGYIIAKAQFQFCHGFAFIADSNFATVAQGYLANVIPDPAIKGYGLRLPVDAGSFWLIPAGESLNN